jgi:hypothetical protein
MVNTALIIPRADIFPEKMSNNGPIILRTDTFEDKLFNKGKIGINKKKTKA